MKQIKAAKNPNFRYHHTSLVQDSSMEKWLRSIEFEQDWHDIWNIPYFSEYHDAKCLEFMLQYVPAWRKLYHVIVIGFDSEIKILIEYLAKRVKSLRFILQYMPRDFEEMQEDIYDEYVEKVKFFLFGFTLNGDINDDGTDREGHGGIAVCRFGGD